MNMTAEQRAFVAQVKALCNENYTAGGDVVIECYSDADILRDFKTLDDVRRVCGLRLEQALNAREGNDDDPQLEAMKRFDAGWTEPAQQQLCELCGKPVTPPEEVHKECADRERFEADQAYADAHQDYENTNSPTVDEDMHDGGPDHLW